MSTTTQETATDWSSHARQSIREAGLRRSIPRQRVIDLLADQDCAITALEMDERLSDVGRATVYRAIEQLEELGLVQKVDLGMGAQGFEKVDPSGHHHHHLVCEECGQVQPFEDEQLEKAIHEVRRRGFTVETHEVTLRGHCRDCSS